MRDDSDDPNPPAQRQVLRLTVHGDSYAVPIEAVHEILEAGRLTAIPQSPTFLRGVMNLRGAVVPVIDLGARLGQAPLQLGRRSAIVVVECAGDESQPRVHAGLLVDAVHEVLNIGPGQLEAVPAFGISVPGMFLSGMLKLGQGFAALLSLETLLAPAELAERIGAAQG